MKLHLIDYLILCILAFVISTGFFAYKWIHLRNELALKVEIEKSLKNDLKNRVMFYQSAINIQQKRLNYLKEKIKNKEPEEIIKIKYKTKYEKINSIPDSLQYRYTDSLLSGCRLKPFKRD